MAVESHGEITRFYSSKNNNRLTFIFSAVTVVTNRLREAGNILGRLTFIFSAVTVVFSSSEVKAKEETA